MARAFAYMRSVNVVDTRDVIVTDFNAALEIKEEPLDIDKISISDNSINTKLVYKEKRQCSAQKESELFEYSASKKCLNEKKDCNKGATIHDTQAISKISIKSYSKHLLNENNVNNDYANSNGMSSNKKKELMNNYSKEWRQQRKSDYIATKKCKILSAEALLSSKIECDVCFRTFETVRKFYLHLKKYNRNTKYTCTVCSAEFLCVSSVESHVRSNHLEAHSFNRDNHLKFACDYCTRLFAKKSTMQAHIFHIHLKNMDKSSNIKEKKQNLKNTVLINKTVSIEQKSNNACRDTISTKRMRQTTLTEFMQMSNKTCKTLSKRSIETIDKKTNVLSNSNNSVAQSVQNAVLCDKTFSSTKSNLDRKQHCSSIQGKPFVQIHANTDLLAVLLTDYDQQNRKKESNSVISNNSEKLEDTKTYNLRSTSTIHRKYCSVRRGFTADAEKINSLSLCKKVSIPLVRIDKKITPLSSVDSKYLDTQKSVNNTTVVSNTSVQRDQQTTKNCSTLDLQMEFDSSMWKLKLKKLKVLLTRLPKDIGTANVSTIKYNSESCNTNKKFICKFCKKSFSLDEHRREHIKLFHTVYMSSICNAKFTMKSSLLKHYLQRHRLIKRNKCCVCHQSCSNSTELKQHLLKHCIKVLQSTEDNSSINVDVKCNLLKKNYKCLACRKKFLLNSCLIQHQKVCHLWKQMIMGDKAIFDPEDTELFIIWEKLINSDRVSKSNSIHSGIENTTITTVVKEEEEEREQEQEQGQEQTNGEEQGQRQEQEQEQEQQQQQVPTTRESNIIVPNIFTTDDRRDEQQNRTFSEVEVELTRNLASILNNNKFKFPCLVCGKQFQTYKNLWIHKRVFSKLANDKCEICDTAFSTKRLLRIHINAAHNPTFSSIYQLHCRFCKQGFCKQDNLRVHELHYHAKQIFPYQLKLKYPEKLWNLNTMCTVCNLIFETYERFIEHNMYYYDGCLYKCTFCGEIFQGMYMLHHHNKIVHYPEETKKSYTYKCDICAEGFTLETHLYAHKLHVHCNTQSSEVVTNRINLLGKLCKCPICNAQFVNIFNLIAHIEEFSNSGKFQCNYCNRQFRKLRLLNSHVNVVHNHLFSDCKYQCRICKELLASYYSLLYHEKHFHTSNILQIDHFENSEKLQNGTNSTVALINYFNLSDIRQQFQNFSCSTCGLTFQTKENLDIHVIEYSNHGENICDICQRKFGEINALKKHKLKHSPFVSVFCLHRCPICYEGFGKPIDVTSHLLHLHGRDAFRNIFTKSAAYICGPFNIENTQNKINIVKESRPKTSRSVNDKTIELYEGNRITLVPDVNTRLDLRSTPARQVKRYDTVICDICNMRFSHENHLAEHLNQFSNTGNYVCQFCGRRFNRSKYFKQHEDKHMINPQTGRTRTQQYVCRFCGENFRTPILCHSHISHLHKNEVTEERMRSSKSIQTYNITQNIPFGERTCNINEINNDNGPCFMKDPLAIEEISDPGEGSNEKSIESTNLNLSGITGDMLNQHDSNIADQFQIRIRHDNQQTRVSHDQQVTYSRTDNFLLQSQQAVPSNANVGLNVITIDKPDIVNVQENDNFKIDSGKNSSNVTDLTNSKIGKIKIKPFARITENSLENNFVPHHSDQSLEILKLSKISNNENIN